jgi:hypothetical protein
MSDHVLPNATFLQWWLWRLSLVRGLSSIALWLLACTLTREQRRALRFPT